MVDVLLSSLTSKTLAVDSVTLCKPKEHGELWADWGGTRIVFLDPKRDFDGAGGEGY